MAGYTTIESILRENNLSAYLSSFQEAQLTDNELQLVEDSHLKEMGIPLGPRLKICSALRAKGLIGSTRPQKPPAPSKRPGGSALPLALPSTGPTIDQQRGPGIGGGLPLASSSAFPIRSNDVGLAFPQPQRMSSGTDGNNGLPSSFGHISSRVPEGTGPMSQSFSSSASSTLVPPSPFLQSPVGQINPQRSNSVNSLSSGASGGVEACSCYQVPCICPRTTTPAFGASGASNFGSMFSAFSRGGNSAFAPFSSSAPPNSNINNSSTLFPGPYSSFAPYSQFPSSSSSILPSVANDAWNESGWPTPSGSLVHSSLSQPQLPQHLDHDERLARQQEKPQDLLPPHHQQQLHNLHHQQQQQQQQQQQPPLHNQHQQQQHHQQQQQQQFFRQQQEQEQQRRVQEQQWQEQQRQQQQLSQNQQLSHHQQPMQHQQQQQRLEQLKPSSASQPHSQIQQPQPPQSQFAHLQQQQQQPQSLQQPLQSQLQVQSQHQQQQQLEKQKQVAVEEKFVSVQSKNSDKKNKEEALKTTASQEAKNNKKDKDPQHASSQQQLQAGLNAEEKIRAKTFTARNAFDLLNNESDEEQAEKAKTKAREEAVATKKKDKKKSASATASATTDVATTQSTSGSSSTSAATLSALNKPKCECGQIVHPSVLNPITEFQMQDRQAHLTSKRHKAYLIEQEAIAKKEKEAKLKQEKADAQRAKEDAQRAKEQAQRAIEEAQKVIEQAQRAEEAELEAQKVKENGGKKKGIKKVNKKKDKKSETSDTSNVQDNSNSSASSNNSNNNKNSSAKDAEIKRKKQLASEMQQEANQLYNQGLYAKAVDRYTDGINLNPHSAILYSNRAQAETKCHQYEKAVTDCLKAIELDPSFIKSYHRASSCFVKLGDLPKAKMMLVQCKNYASAASSSSGGLDKKDETPLHVKTVEELELALANVKKFMQERNHKDAIDLLQTKIMNAMPEALSCHYLLAECYVLTGNFNAAHDVAHKFMSKYPSLPETRMLESLFAYYDEAKLEQAAEILKSLLVEDKQNQKAAKLLDKIQRIDTAKKSAEESHLRKNYPKSVHGFAQALNIDRENKHVTATLLCLRAGVYFNMGHYNDAKKDLDESVELWNTFLRARKLRASVNEKLGNNQAVVDDCRYILDEGWDARTNDMMKAAKQSRPTQDFKGYYAALAIPLDANVEEITRSYKRLAMRWNPEKWNGNTEDKRAEADLQFRAIAVAYEVLSDPAKRVKYDSCDAEGKIKCDCGRHNVECYIDLR